MRIHGFMTFLLLHFVSSKGERREKWQQGHKWAEAASALSLKLMQFCLIEGGGHTNWQIEQICAINCGIQWNATNKSITKYENLFGVKSIFESIQRFARYRIGALILIGRLCTDTWDWNFDNDMILSTNFDTDTIPIRYFSPKSLVLLIPIYILIPIR